MARTLLGLLVVFLALTGSTPGLAAAGPGVGADDPALRRGGVPTVQVTATVPTRARATIAGHRVAVRVARPTVLQRRSPTGWAQIDRSTTRRGGSVTFTLAAPTATTTYRVVAPAHRTGGTPVTGRTAVISADGRRVLFITSLPLSAEDTDRTDDLYVWSRPA